MKRSLLKKKKKRSPVYYANYGHFKRSIPKVFGIRGPSALQRA
jgi:hypothetical protein